MQKLLITGGRVLDSARGLDTVCDIAIAAGRVRSVGSVPVGFVPDRTIDARGRWVLPGLVDLAVRLREPGQEHAAMLVSEMAAAAAGGVTSLVCLPDTDPVLDERGPIEMLKYRAQNLHLSRLFPMGALTRGLQGQALTELAELTDSGCVAFGQADVPLQSNRMLQRALAYAHTYGYAVWLRPQDASLSDGVAASGALATRMGLSGVPVAAETIALHTIFELIRGTDTRVHLCRISSAAGVQLLRQAKAQGLNVTADVSINALHLTENDLGYFDSRARLVPPLRQQRDREALAAALADGTIDALVSDHCPVEVDAKDLPFAEAAPGATGLELLLPLVLKWQREANVPLLRALHTVTAGPACVLGAALGTLEASLGRIVEGGVADLCIIDPQSPWTVTAPALRSQCKSTPFGGYEMPASVCTTVVAGQVVFDRD